MNHRCLLQSLLFIVGSLIFWEGCNFKTQDKSTLEFPLPLNLKAVYWGSDVQYPIVGLVILDEMNFVIVGRGDDFLVNGDTVEVEKISKLGIGDSKLLIEVLDNQGDTFYIDCIKNGDKTKNHVNLIAFYNNHRASKDSVNWIEADEILKRLK